ncbi:FMN-binding protein [Sanguibacter antarcticus]|uniref:FMN-binding protein n=1 Tax=Sanguibacter antarcticus TaxID=372484 RepID=A0A2A9E3S1_9MICO|nr:FMN-binding protein [Sanguibacter antarcticus]PFG33005.1 FMN-binding protein [Sanguibacter antarcticus]
MSGSSWRGTLIFTGSIAALGALVVARFGLVEESEEAAPTSMSEDTSSAVSASTDSSTEANPSEVSAPADGAATSGAVTVAGSLVQTRYGPVQVSVTFDGAQIVDVQELQSPYARVPSAQTSERVMPMLAQEVIDAQSAEIDAVSGASYTSKAYCESVQAAIDQMS